MENMIASPVGPLQFRCENDQLTQLAFVTKPQRLTKPTTPFAKEVFRQLNAYFNEDDFKFDLPLNYSGTDFQKRVWLALQKIPAGETRTYSELALLLKSGARAVGNACRTNPIALIIPCHRVVAKNSLGGFAGNTSGEFITVKTKLLQHENAIATTTI